MKVSRHAVVAKVNLFLWPTLLYFLGAALYGIWQYNEIKTSLLSEIDSRLTLSANALVAILPAEFSDELRALGGVPEEKDLANTEKLSHYAWSSDVRYVYTLVEQGGIIYFTASSATKKEWEDRSFTTYFQSYDEAAPAFHQGFKTQKSFSTTYSDRWGNFRTVCLEKRSPQGKFYFACADYDVSYVDGLLAENMRRTFLVAAFFILLGMPFLYVSNRKQVRDKALLQLEIEEKTQVQEKLQVLYEELDQRVRERTRELEESVLKKQLEVQRREEIQRKLQASEQRLELTIQSAGIGLWDWNLITGQVDISNEWLNMLGYERSEVAPNIDSWRALIDPEQKTEVESALNAHVRGQTDVFRTEQRLRSRNGDYKWILVVGKLVEWDDAGKPLRLLGVHIDIDDEKRASAQLKEARDAAEASNKIKSEFMATMSHELRTPLNAIIGFTNRLLSTPLTPAQQENLQRVSSSSQMLFGIIRDILDFSKLEAGRYHLDESEFLLSDTLKNLDAWFQEPAKKKQLGFQVHCADAVPQKFVGDPLRITQVLMNLVSNAIKFTETGEVVVSVDVQHKDEQCAELLFKVKDTGIGISHENAQRMFEAFSQADGSHSRRYGGAGLGLTIAKQLAELMNGSLTYHSELNKGTEFCLSVPLKLAQNTVAESIDAAAEPQHSLSGYRVLLVDDIEANRELALELLNDFGIYATCAENGAEAVAAAICLPFDLILMDVQMPVMDGLAATQQIRACGLKMPIVAMTANAMPGDKEKCLSAGMTDYLAKPISTDLLQAALVRGLQNIKPVMPPKLNPAGVSTSEVIKQDTSSLIDEKSALERLGNRTSLYGKLLKSFLDTQRDQGTALRQHMQSGDKEKSLLIAHSIKSSAGSIGASSLSKIAGEIEHLLRSGEEVDTSALGNFEHSLQNAITAIEELRSRYHVA